MDQSDIAQAIENIMSGVHADMDELTLQNASARDVDVWSEFVEGGISPGNTDGHMIESFDDGHIALMFLNKKRTEAIVGVKSSAGISVVKALDPEGGSNAYELYGGLEMDLGILGEKCIDCGIPIPAVFDICDPCDDLQIAQMASRPKALVWPDTTGSSRAEIAKANLLSGAHALEWPVTMFETSQEHVSAWNGFVETGRYSDSSFDEAFLETFDGGHIGFMTASDKSAFIVGLKVGDETTLVSFDPECEDEDGVYSGLEMDLDVLNGACFTCAKQIPAARLEDVCDACYESELDD